MTGAHDGNDIMAKHNSLESRLQDLKAACDDHVESVKSLVAAIEAHATISDPEMVTNWTRIVMLEAESLVTICSLSSPESPSSSSCSLFKSSIAISKGIPEPLVPQKNTLMHT